MKVLVAYDGTLNSKDALRHGIKKVREQGGELIAMHVFNRDAVIYYDAAPWTVDKIRKEVDRFSQEAETILREEGKGIKAIMVEAEGNPDKEIVKYVMKQKVDLLLCPSSLKSVVNKYSKALQERGLADGVVHASLAPEKTQ